MIPKEAVFDKLERLEPYLVPAIVVLVALAAFGLGRLSATPQKQALRVLYPGAQLASPVGATGSMDTPLAEGAAQGQVLGAGEVGAYVASRSGSKYYLAICAGAERIKQENRVYFVSTDEAKAAGYEPAANCPGL